jgi:hypothetical protein
MFIWGLVLFGLGILAVLDSQFNYGYVFRSANSFVFLLVSLGLLIRTRMLEKLGFKEQLLESNKELRANVEELKHSQTATEKRESKQEVMV